MSEMLAGPWCVLLLCWLLLLPAPLCADPVISTTVAWAGADGADSTAELVIDPSVKDFRPAIRAWVGKHLPVLGASEKEAQARSLEDRVCQELLEAAKSCGDALLCERMLMDRGDSHQTICYRRGQEVAKTVDRACATAGCSARSRKRLFSHLVARLQQEAEVLRDRRQDLLDRLKEAERPYLFWGLRDVDREVYEAFFKEEVDPEERRSSGGVFVELGANDGVTYSNTLFFEDFLGWRGVLLEPQREFFEQLQINRPQAITLNVGVCEFEGGVANIRGHGMTASLVEGSEPGPATTQGESVPCAPLGRTLHMVGIRHIDLLSVDVEGLELYVLRSHDWTNIPVHVVLVESRDPPGPREVAARAFMLDPSRGFRFAMRVDNNDVYVKDSFERPATPRQLFRSDWERAA